MPPRFILFPTIVYSSCIIFVYQCQINVPHLFLSFLLILLLLLMLFCLFVFLTTQSPLQSFIRLLGLSTPHTHKYTLFITFWKYFFTHIYPNPVFCTGIEFISSTIFFLLERFTFSKGQFVTTDYEIGFMRRSYS